MRLSFRVRRLAETALGATRRLNDERARADDIDDDAPCIAIFEHLDAVDRVLRCPTVVHDMGSAYEWTLFLSPQHHVVRPSRRNVRQEVV